MRQITVLITFLSIFAVVSTAQIPSFQPIAMGYVSDSLRLVYGRLEPENSINIIDVDNDGDLDIYAGHSFLYSNNGTNEEPYYEIISYPTPFGNGGVSQGWTEWSRKIGRMKDLTGNGYPDFMMESKIQSGASYFWTQLRLYVDLQLSQIIVDDYYPLMGNYTHANGDSLIDYLFGSLMFINTGTSNSPFYEVDSSIVIPSNVATSGDIDNDGDWDLFIHSGDAVAFYENIGTPFEPNYSFVTNNYCEIIRQSGFWMELSDYDLDGDLDFFAGLTYYENVGSPDSANYQFRVVNFLSPFTDYYTYNDHFCLTDIDADQDLDLIFMQTGTISYYENIGTPEEHKWDLTVQPILDNIYYGNQFEFADMDADGDLDFITDQPEFYENVGDSVNFDYQAWQVSSTALNNLGKFVFADVDSDNDYDIIENDTPDLCLYLNTGTSSNPIFETAPEMYLSDCASGWISFPIVADYDNDDDVDVFITSISDNGPYDPVLSYSYFRNDGTLENPIWFEYEGLLPGILEGFFTPNGYAADMNNDGTKDIILRSSDGVFYYQRTDELGIETEEFTKNKHPVDFSLSVYPNPFNNRATISLQIVKTGRYEVALYNLQGQKVLTLADRAFNPGIQQIQLDAKFLSSGIYFVTLQNDGFSNTQKIVLLK
ncbi:MAG: T9SS type A sorting domain-containing protein [FCB group bacterium]|nr:T9SS type A sorting domain-containing protein [FCB group bacterium]